MSNNKTKKKKQKTEKQFSIKSRLQSKYPELNVVRWSPLKLYTSKILHEIINMYIITLTQHTTYTVMFFDVVLLFIHQTFA